MEADWPLAVIFATQREREWEVCVLGMCWECRMVAPVMKQADCTLMRVEEAEQLC